MLQEVQAAVVMSREKCQMDRLALNSTFPTFFLGQSRQGGLRVCLVAIFLFFDPAHGQRAFPATDKFGPTQIFSPPFITSGARPFHS